MRTPAISPIAGSPFVVNDSIDTYAIATSPKGRLLSVTNETNTVIPVYAFTPAAGMLIKIQGSPFAADANIEPQHARSGLAAISIVNY